MTLRIIGSAFLSIVTLACGAYAKQGDMIELMPLDYSMPTPSLSDDIERALMTDLTETFRNFKPSGQIRDFDIRGTGSAATVTFRTVKYFGPIPVSISVKAVVETPTKIECPHPSVGGYRIDFDLSGSDNRVSDNANLLRIESCVVPNDDGSVSMRARSWMREGKSYGGKSGKLMQETLSSEIGPMLSALGARVAEFSLERTAKAASAN